MPDNEQQSATTKLLLALGILGVASLALASLAGIFGRWWWLLDLCSHFRLQYAVLSIPLLALLVVLRAWRWALVAGLVFVLNTSLILPLYWGRASDIDMQRPSLHMVVFNVNYGNQRIVELAQYLAEADCDVILLLEATIAMRKELERALPDYQIFGEGRTDAFGMLALTRLPVRKSEVLSLAESLVPAIALELSKDGESFSILGLHTMPPIGAKNSALRNAMMREASAWARNRDNAVIAGDFNATPWSFAFIDMMDNGNLHNSQRGFGLQTTWPSQMWPMSIPIDHCLHAPSLRTIERSVGPFLGSDHRPVHLRLGFAKHRP